MTLDPRMLSGPALITLGGMFLFLGWRLWRVHPLNRVLSLGPFVTERGMRAVIGMRLSFVAFGLFLSVQGMVSVIFWFARRDVNDPTVAFLGALAAGLGLWAAGMALWGLSRFRQEK